MSGVSWERQEDWVVSTGSFRGDRRTSFVTASALMSVLNYLHGGRDMPWIAEGSRQGLDILAAPARVLSIPDY